MKIYEGLVTIFIYKGPVAIQMTIQYNQKIQHFQKIQMRFVC